MFKQYLDKRHGDYNWTCTRLKYWIMHVIFERSHLSDCSCYASVLLSGRFVADLYWMVAVLHVPYLSSVDMGYGGK